MFLLNIENLMSRFHCLYLNIKVGYQGSYSFQHLQIQPQLEKQQQQNQQHQQQQQIIQQQKQQHQQQFKQFGQLQQQQQNGQQLQQQQNQKNEKKKNFFDFYKSGKQKIMISFYNIYRNYPSNPPSFSANSPLWLMGKSYNTHNGASKSTALIVTSGFSSCSSENMIYQQNPYQFEKQHHQQQQQQQSTSLNINSLFSSIFQSSNNSNSSSSSSSNSSSSNSSSSSSSSQQLPTPKCNNTMTPLHHQSQIITPTHYSPNNNNTINNREEANQEIDRFIADFKNILWFSYRKDFAPIENTNITTDIGWGCMVRTGQMLLARALLRHLYQNENIPEVDRTRPSSKYRKVMNWFCDLPTREHYYSIHQIVHKNKIIAKYHNSKLKDFDIETDENIDLLNVDEWFAPTKISVVLKHLLKSHGLSDITMYVPSDGVVYKDYVRKLCTDERLSFDPESSGINSGCNSYIIDGNAARVPSMQSYQYKSASSFGQNSPSNPAFSSFVPSKSPPSSMEEENYLVGENSGSFKDPLTCSDFFSSSCIPQRWKSIIILVPIKLGLDKLNEVYFREIKSMLELPQSIGLIGGKPKQSFYFVGYQDEHIIYLDPHFVHDTVSPNDINFSDSYHHCVPQKMLISQLDPSMAIGFYCHTQSDFEDFCVRIKEIEKRGFPVVSVGEQCPDYQVESDDVDLDEFEEECENSFINNLQGQVSDFIGANNNSNSNNNTKFEDSEDDLDGFTMVN
ncbi:autophagy protein 4 [Heterostelium album PN500]|uniref:Cysteine protease n=1 Tax=Heterostelium pallidum (strain ATCC 26659 / Pp 5 / PN500) TaxID=670386 RepID=D3B266_HETP5|nr:autophagy protein 4 [Heterostelium album PN500]EFA84441.1 autophagy protein 4 [Heterostelium album PN500]|eukprot:XP_020436555.1 autophagy protein 4 [Heterostelium album PN500]